jgi:hypothetical protein
MCNESEYDQQKVKYPIHVSVDAGDFFRVSACGVIIPPAPENSDIAQCQFAAPGYEYSFHQRNYDLASYILAVLVYGRESDYTDLQYYLGCGNDHLGQAHITYVGKYLSHGLYTGLGFIWQRQMPRTKSLLGAA